MNLAVAGYRVARVLQAGLVLLLLASLGYAGWAWLEARRVAGRTVAHAQSVARVQAINRDLSAALVRDGLTRRQPEIEQVHQRVAFANEIGRRRALSWTGLLTDLEAGIPGRVSIQSVRLEVKDAAVTLTGHAMTLRDLDALVAGLEEHDGFHGVRIVSHHFQEIEEERPFGGKQSTRPVARGTKPRKHQVVEFELSAGYARGEEGDRWHS